jgi:hypothetical protein
MKSVMEVYENNFTRKMVNIVDVKNIDSFTHILREISNI